MGRREKWAKLLDNPIVEWSMFGLGVILLIVSPLVGLALILKTSMWAKRHYARFKRWQPKAGRWTDWALRRPSAQRREAIRKSERN
jgi:hypothetical protein